MPMSQLRKTIRLIPFWGGTILLIPIFAVFALLSIPASFATGPEPAAGGVQLIMIEDPGCPYCARWHEEVGPSYAASAEGRFARLVRRGRNHPEVAKFENIIYSPTFIIARNGVEIGRIVGYPGPDFFWGFLTNILKRAGFSGQSNAH